ncbi:hypothetical protein BDE36_2471 [Arcticibacter tournemirensis]|uniref:Uncharacterized protein n=1 Tax=Arcticibacter tournemirensis TaxID=699437 RepID=A0A5M9GWF4_9SPHI|nr:BfmA/BtgA family mobilization protein [Arcticibacter tournemirensis]KAA8478259.1 hypothetical protein F1649_18160 [Arcticibacter tournemirensis]TQM50713.1 hypothetical protein BDE36_2471 [Arcticibacter tournemirensis]
MEDVNKKTIRFPNETGSKLEKTARKLGRTKVQLFIQMVDYFYHTKKDPADLNDEALKTAILKGNQHLTGFIKAQEQSLLIPIRQDTERMINSQRRILEWLTKEEAAHHNSTASNLQHQTQKLSEIDLLVRQIGKQLQQKEQLKSQFMLILEAYIKAREQFSLMTSAREKDELVSKVKQQVKNL